MILDHCRTRPRHSLTLQMGALKTRDMDITASPVNYVYDLACVACSFSAYIFQLALQVSEVVTERPVLRQKPGVLSILGAQSRLKFPQLSQRICQITLLLLVPEVGRTLLAQQAFFRASIFTSNGRVNAGIINNS